MILLMVLFGSSKLGDYYTVKENWGEYRCQTEFMLLASLFGHDTGENLKFCLQSGFDSRASVSVAPFYGILSGFTGVLGTLLSSINSIRLVFATLVGNISQVFTDFSSRVEALMYRIQYSAIRLKFLMSRIFGTMYSIMYMGMSGIKATQNFSNTSLFKFIAGMACFPPETLVSIKDKGSVEMKDVLIGDMIEWKRPEKAEKSIRVTGTLVIVGDGQQMIDMSDCSVSAPHFIREEGKWIHARDSKNGKKGELWAGGNSRPLTCLITSNHRLPIGDKLFSDYHESEDADTSTMNGIMKKLNGATNSHRHDNYITGVDPATEIMLEDGTYCPASSLTLGTRVRNGTIVAIMLRECSTFTTYKGERFGYATAIWKGKSWLRGDEMDVRPGFCINFAVSPSAILETRAGTLFRDMFEIHDLDIQSEYTSAMQRV